MKIKEFKGMKLVLYAMLFFLGVNCSNSDQEKDLNSVEIHKIRNSQATNDVDFYLTKGNGS